MNPYGLRRYPRYQTQPFTGALPSMWSEVNRASDLTYSSSTAPHYEDRIMASHGRQLAGVGEVQDEQAQQGWALNELRVYAEMDDVQGNGVFDPPDDPNVPNIYPDAGVFASRYDLPGYMARERMFAPSEVRDVTTGRPIVPVLNSPIAYDTSAQVAFIERGMYGQPKPVVSAASVAPTGFESTVNVRQNPLPISGYGGGMGEYLAPTAAAAPAPAALIEKAAPPTGRGMTTGMWLGVLAVAAGGAWALSKKRRRQ